MVTTMEVDVVRLSPRIKESSALGAAMSVSTLDQTNSAKLPHCNSPGKLNPIKSSSSSR